MLLMLSGHRSSAGLTADGLGLRARAESRYLSTSSALPASFPIAYHIIHHIGIIDIVSSEYIATLF